MPSCAAGFREDPLSAPLQGKGGGGEKNFGLDRPGKGGRETNLLIFMCVGTVVFSKEGGTLKGEKRFLRGRKKKRGN